MGKDVVDVLAGDRRPEVALEQPPHVVPVLHEHWLVEVVPLLQVPHYRIGQLGIPSRYAERIPWKGEDGEEHQKRGAEEHRHDLKNTTDQVPHIAPRERSSQLMGSLLQVDRAEHAAVVGVGNVGRRAIRHHVHT